MKTSWYIFQSLVFCGSKLVVLLSSPIINPSSTSLQRLWHHCELGNTWHKPIHYQYSACLGCWEPCSGHSIENGENSNSRRDGEDSQKTKKKYVNITQLLQNPSLWLKWPPPLHFKLVESQWFNCLYGNKLPYLSIYLYIHTINDNIQYNIK